MSILIKQVLLDSQRVDILIENKYFSKIARRLDIDADTLIDGKQFAILPAFYNTHTHAAMTLLRSFADDIELHTWLNDHIWPLERIMTEKHIYHGSRLAALEMIKSGTVYFNDMYWNSTITALAVDEMGLRADISILLNDAGDPGKSEEQLQNADAFFLREHEFSDRIRFTWAPHAIYTVSKKTLSRCAERARENGRRIHIHLSETQREVENSIKQFGERPVEYLDTIGFLDSNVMAAHCVHLSEREREILKKHEVSIAHCPSSNMKLSSGYFDYKRARSSGITICLGTDGASSNNSLSMLSEMKFAALWAKSISGDPTIAPASEIFDMASCDSAVAVGLNAGRIEEGRLADCLMVDLAHPSLLPAGHLISNMVYSADPECINTVICDGRILMRDRIVPGERGIIRDFREAYLDMTRLSHKNRY